MTKHPTPPRTLWAWQILPEQEGKVTAPSKSEEVKSQQICDLSPSDMKN